MRSYLKNIDKPTEFVNHRIVRRKCSIDLSKVWEEALLFFLLLFMFFQKVLQGVAYFIRNFNLIQSVSTKEGC
jgi:hypothetical protein